MRYTRPYVESIEKSDGLAVGDDILVRFEKGNINNRTYHVRGFVDNRIIVRIWSRRWNSWNYEVLADYFFNTFGLYLKIVSSRKVIK